MRCTPSHTRDAGAEERARPVAIPLRWKQQAKRLKGEVIAVYLACRDPRVPWYAKALAICVVGYTLSPIDLIPDPVPILGYLDDLIIVPLGMALVLRMIPPEVLIDCREKAKEIQERPRSWVAASIIVAIWISTALAVAVLVIRVIRR
jgi:uncharacterized membrane protein YkvA (DUF1232 family)